MSMTTKNPQPSAPGGSDPARDDEVMRPVLAGVIALLGVALTVGIIVGGAVMVAAKVTGLGSDGTSTGARLGAAGRETLYLPTPSPTQDAGGPSISLGPGASSPASSYPESSLSSSPADSKITLTGPTTVQPMENIDLTGTYPGGDGAVLQVQRLEEGKWVDFLSVNALVNGQTFSTYVQTSRPGPMKWRMVDTSTGETSNPITVTVGS